MNEQIYIAGSRKHLTAELYRVLAEIEAASGDDVEATICGEWNDSRRGEALVTFSNDDMERPEVAEKIIVDVE